MQTAASTDPVASEATATPSSEAIPEGPRSIAPAIGSGETARRVRATWQKELSAHLDKHKKYPKDRSQQAAEIAVRFTLDRMGRVLSVSIEKGSGDAAFDEAALSMVRSRPRARAAAIDRGRGVELYRAGDLPRQIEEGLSGVGRRGAYDAGSVWSARTAALIIATISSWRRRPQADAMRSGLQRPPARPD